MTMIMMTMIIVIGIRIIKGGTGEFEYFIDARRTR
jgi:hypothetical protein